MRNSPAPGRRRSAEKTGGSQSARGRHRTRLQQPPRRDSRLRRACLGLARLGADRHEAADDIRSIISAADNAAALTRQLLAFARRQALTRTVLDLNDVAREASDLMMRGNDGRETVERIRALAPGTKVLFRSGYTNEPSTWAAAAASETGFIQKPFGGDELAGRVRDLLDQVA